MKTILPVMLTLSFALAGCMPPFTQGSASPTPAVDVAASAAAMIQTLAAQTSQAGGTATLVPSSTPPVAASSTPTQVPTATATQPATATPTSITGTPGTPGGTLIATLVGETATLHAQFFGTRPPFVPSGRLILQNRAHAEVYVSFQCINEENSLTILEYPVTRWMELKFPSGKCNYVAWVGGRQFLGKFALERGGQRTIIFFRDQIKIK